MTNELGITAPTASEFAAYAQHRRVVPVVQRLLADSETPLSIYRKLAAGRPGTFLLESAEQAGLHARYSIIGAASRATLTTDAEGRAVWLGDVPVGVPSSGPIMEVLSQTLSLLRTDPFPDLPMFTGGLVGMIGYDAVRHWEKLPDTGRNDLHLPDISLMLATDLAVLDHKDGTVLLVANAINWDGSDSRVREAYLDAASRVEAMARRLAVPADSSVAVAALDANATAVPQMQPEDFYRIVERAKSAIYDGEVFQVVPSERFDVPCEADPLDVYRILRATNPSPYMYLMRLSKFDGSGFDVVGTSPEALVTLQDGIVSSHPIAGSRPRGKDPEQDTELAAELLVDPKERAEHLMLVDLARNDLARVSQPGTVEVTEFMTIERFSHIMHISSTVTGHKRPEVSAYDVLKAAFPAGTLSGAPKVRAMELIDEFEPTRRGLYGGTVGYFDFAGNMDMAIAIRTALIQNGVAHVQAGAGIVADSVPETEHEEATNKAAAAVRAVAVARTLKRQHS